MCFVTLTMQTGCCWEPFKYYVSKEVDGWGQKCFFLVIYSTIYADIGGLIVPKHADVILEWSLVEVFV